MATASTTAAPAASAEHVVLILAAGGSRRLGRAKQLLCCQGETLVRRTIALASATQPKRIFVVVGAEREAICRELADFDFTTVSNDNWPSGLASSLQAGAAALRQHAGPVLILVCDQLHLTLPQLQALLAAAASAPGSNIASAYGGSVGIPVVASPALLQSVSALAEDRGLKAALQSGQWPLQTIEAEALGIDLDTPAQLQHAIAQGWLDPL